MTPDSYFTLTFYARKPKTEKSEYPLYARISVGGQMTEFTIGRSVNPKHWNQKRNQSDGTSRRDKELNKFLEMVRARGARSGDFFRQMQQNTPSRRVHQPRANKL